MIKGRMPLTSQVPVEQPPELCCTCQTPICQLLCRKRNGVTLFHLLFSDITLFSLSVLFLSLSLHCDVSRALISDCLKTGFTTACDIFINNSQFSNLSFLIVYRRWYTYTKCRVLDRNCDRYTGTEGDGHKGETWKIQRGGIYSELRGEEAYQPEASYFTSGASRDEALLCCHRLILNYSIAAGHIEATRF